MKVKTYFKKFLMILKTYLETFLMKMLKYLKQFPIRVAKTWERGEHALGTFKSPRNIWDEMSRVARRSKIGTLEHTGKGKHY